MGYDIYITRASVFWEAKSYPISEQEWISVAEADPTLERSEVDSLGIKLDDGQVGLIHPWIYTAHPGRPPLWYINGAVETKNPDPQTISKMVGLARRLGAKVIGEEGELHDESGQITASNPGVEPKKPPWFHRIFRK